MLVVRFWDYVCRLYDQSLLSRIVSGLWRFWKRGLIYSLLTHNSRLDPLWRESFLYCLLHRILDIVPSLLSRIGGPIKSAAETSVFCSFFRRIVKNTAFLLGAALFVLLTVPQQMWNNLYSLAMAFICLIFYWIYSSSHRSDKLSLDPIGIWPVLFAVVSCLSFIWSQDMALSLRHLLFNITCIVFVITLVSAVDSKKKLFRLVCFLAAGLIVCCAYAVMQRAAGIAPSSSFTDLDANAGMPGRVFSFFENPNAFANILVFFTPTMVAMIFYSERPWQRVGFALASALCALALVMTYSRGGWLSLALSIFILMLLLCPRWVPLLMIVAAAMIPFLPSTILARLLSIFLPDSSIGSRSYIYSAMVRLIKKNWFYGVGLGTTTLKRGIYYYGVFTSPKFPFVHAHNILLEIWGESGILAVISFVLSIFFTMRKGCTSLKKTSSSPLRGILAGSTAGLFGAMFFGLTDYAWSYPRVLVLFWFLFGIICAASRLAQEKDGLING